MLGGKRVSWAPERGRWHFWKDLGHFFWCGRCTTGRYLVRRRGRTLFFFCTFSAPIGSSACKIRSYALRQRFESPFSKECAIGLVGRSLNDCGCGRDDALLELRGTVHKTRLPLHSQKVEPAYSAHVGCQRTFLRWRVDCGVGGLWTLWWQPRLSVMRASGRGRAGRQTPPMRVRRRSSFARRDRHRC